MLSAVAGLTDDSPSNFSTWARAGNFVRIGTNEEQWIHADIRSRQATPIEWLTTSLESEEGAPRSSARLGAGSARPRHSSLCAIDPIDCYRRRPAVVSRSMAATGQSASEASDRKSGWHFSISTRKADLFSNQAGYPCPCARQVRARASEGRPRRVRVGHRGVRPAGPRRWCARAAGPSRAAWSACLGARPIASVDDARPLAEGTNYDGRHASCSRENRTRTPGWSQSTTSATAIRRADPRAAHRRGVRVRRQPWHCRRERTDRLRPR